MDRFTIEDVGLPSLVLMEVAGRAVADAAERVVRGGPAGVLRERGGVLCLAGTGNNGADAVVAARHLKERGLGATVALLGSRDALTPEAKTQIHFIERLGLEPLVLEGEKAPQRVADLALRHAVLVDGLFGMGLRRPVEGWRGHVIDALEEAAKPVVAVDIPSGVDANTGQVLGTAVTADVTVTFQFAKLGQLLHPGRARCGVLEVVDIGIPGSELGRVGPVAGILEEDTLAAALPPRRADAHKGTFGHLLVVAGAPDRPGSALLAARAALRAGVGLVTVGSDRETIARLSPALVEVMGLTLGDGQVELDPLLAALESRSAVAIGPSLTPDEATRSLLKDVLGRSTRPVVLDAGALSALGRDLSWMKDRGGPTVLTPHPGEAGRLLGVDAKDVQKDRIHAACRISGETGAVTVLKGATTVVAEPEGSVALALEGNPGLATGGTGDVLTGIIGALLAQGVEAGLAARAGVLLHGRAGDRAARELGERAVIASDVVRYLASPLEPDA